MHWKHLSVAIAVVVFAVVAVAVAAVVSVYNFNNIIIVRFHSTVVCVERIIERKLYANTEVNVKRNSLWRVIFHCDNGKFEQTKRTIIETNKGKRDDKIKWEMRDSEWEKERERKRNEAIEIDESGIKTYWTSRAYTVWC